MVDKKKKILVTGAAGFIGSTLVDKLLERQHCVIGVDDFSTGQEYFLTKARMCAKFSLERVNILEQSKLVSCMRGVDFVFHLAANADVRYGASHPKKDFEQNARGTLNVLEAMRVCGVSHIAFASTGSIYGEASIFPTPENHPFPVQTSLYGASKLAAEGLIQAYAEAFGIRAHIFRFVSILGERYTHGHIIDFYRQLIRDGSVLRVLGNGGQKKSYLYVQDCIDAILIGIERAQEKVNIFNLGTDEFCRVNDSIKWICEELEVKPRIEYGGGERGWIGDSPFIFLDCSGIRRLEWRPKLTIRDAVIRTVAFLKMNEKRIVRGDSCG